MQATLASRVQSAAVARPATVSRSSTRMVVCKAQKTNAQTVKKVAAAIASLPALVAASPAFALVDNRLNGDGTGLPLGVNEPAVGWALFGVFSLLWVTWFNGQKDLGDFNDPSDGLDL